MNSYRFAGTRVQTGKRVSDQVNADCEEAARTALTEQGIACDTIHRVEPWPTRFQWRVFGWTLASAVFVILLVLTVIVGDWWWNEREWLKLQDRQLATIERIGEFPPDGWDRSAWKSEIGVLYNVWGNVISHPKDSNVSNQEMRSLQIKLEQILAETTPNNSVESVDRIFDLLLQRGQKIEFISNYRDASRPYWERK